MFGRFHDFGFFFTFGQASWRTDSPQPSGVHCRHLEARLESGRKSREI